MNGNRLKFAAIAFAGFLSLPAARPSEGGEDVSFGPSAQTPLPDAAGFSRGAIPPIDVASAGHVSTVKNGVKFDVYFNKGPNTNAAIYAINTGRKQLVLEQA